MSLYCQNYDTKYEAKYLKYFGAVTESLIEIPRYFFIELGTTIVRKDLSPLKLVYRCNSKEFKNYKPEDIQNIN